MCRFYEVLDMKSYYGIMFIKEKGDIMKQELLRKYCKYLKWEKGIPFNMMAESIGMDKYSFYNFISGRKASLGYRKEWLLLNYLKENGYER